MFSRSVAYGAAIIYVLIVGLSFMFIKLALPAGTPLDILAGRFLVAFVAGTVILLFNKKKIKIKIRDILQILPLAMFYPVLFFTFQVFGLAYVTSAEAGIIQACAPIITLILAAVFLKEQSSLGENLLTLLSVVGVIYIFLMSSSEAHYTDILGIILVLLSTLAASCYNVMAKNLTARYSVYILTYIMTVVGMIVFNGANIIQHMLTNIPYWAPFWNRQFFLSMLYLGVLSSLLSSFLSNYALARIEATKMSLFANLGTLITIAAGVIFLHEQLHYYQIIGAILILFGVIGTNYLAVRRLNR